MAIGARGAVLCCAGLIIDRSLTAYLGIRAKSGV